MYITVTNDKQKCHCWKTNNLLLQMILSWILNYLQKIIYILYNAWYSHLKQHSVEFFFWRGGGYDSQSRGGKNLECHICIYSWKSILANKTRELIFTLQSQPTSQIFPQKFMDYIKKLKICITIELESSHKNGYLEHEPYIFSLHYKSIHILLNHGSVAPEIK